MPDKKNKLYIAIPIIVALFFAGGIYLGSQLNFSTSKKSGKVFTFPNGGSSKLNDIINYIDDEYVDEVKKEKLVDQAIQTILEDLDPHSYYISASELQAMSEPLEGSFEGIGVQFSIQHDTVVVISPVNGGPSEKVGVRSGDRIIGVNGETIAGIDISNKTVMSLLKGEKGTKVDVTVLRNHAKKIDFTITRDEIPIHSLDVAYMLDKDIGYIKLSRFSKNTYEEFMDAAIGLKEKGMQKLIFDLRGNGGGYMDAATNIVDEFLEKGKMMVYTNGRARPKESYYATDKNTFLDTDVAVLIDEGSASASEIIAGAIQDNDRGMIIGRRSFGKGLVQEQSMWPDGSATRLTIARYHTPTGRCIQRSYNKGLGQYKEDYAERFENGELYSADKIDFPDSLEYTTPEGRTVYGGGGIMPDVFVPVDTVGSSQYLSELVYRGSFYQFAFDYADKHREMLNDFGKYQGFDSYFDKNRKKILNEFTGYANEGDVKFNEREFEESEERIAQRLKAQIARNIWDDEAFYPIFNRDDNTIQKAASLLNRSVSLAELNEIGTGKEKQTATN